MAKSRLINGLPHNLVQSFFSTMRYCEKGYMTDWIVNASIGLNVTKIKIDLLKKKITPKEFEIKPIMYNINDLDRIIQKAISYAGLTRNYIKEANFEIEILDNYYLKCRTILISENGKIYTTKDYVEKSYERFKVVNLSIFDILKDWTKKKFYKFRYVIFGRLIFRKIRYTKRIENMIK